jgi:hypothetical protein
VAKKCDDVFLDAMLERIDDCTTLTVTSAEPPNQAGIAAVALASVTLTGGVGNGDYSKGNGDTSGRKLTIAQQADVPITASGTATHLVIDDGANIYVTTVTSQALTSGGSVTIPSWRIEVADPS